MKPIAVFRKPYPKHTAKPPTDPRNPWTRPPFWAGRPRQSPTAMIAAQAERDRALLVELHRVRTSLNNATKATHTKEQYRSLVNEARSIEAELGLTGRTAIPRSRAIFAGREEFDECD